MLGGGSVQCLPCIVGAGADEAHCEDGVVGDLRVGVVRELAQRVKDLQPRVGHYGGRRVKIMLENPKTYPF